MKETKKEVAIIDFTKFDVAQLPELKGKKDEIAKLIKANPVVEITDNASYELAKKSRTAVKTLRTGLQSEQKDVKKKIKECVLDVVDAEYDLIIESVKIDENARQEPVTAWETAKENEKVEKARLEQERVDGIKNSISEFKTDWSGRISELSFADLENFDVEFGETLVNYDKSVFQEFEVLFTDAVSNLTYMLSEKKATLVAQENIRIAQIELDKEKERQRLESERIAEEQRIEREKFEAKQKAIAEKQRIAQEKFLAEKKEFEEKQVKEKEISAFELQIKNRIIELVSYGLKFDFQSTYTDGNFFIDILDIKTYDDEKWNKLISAIIRVQNDKSDKEIIESILITENPINKIEVVSEEVKSDEIAKSIVEFPKEVVSFLMASASLVSTQGNTYLYFPYWMKLSDKYGVFEILKWDDLPSDLKEHINEQRTQELTPKN